ncbi:MAG: hypothetical protein HC801_12030 [Nitrospira sp.]|nr:hypothetical protein [Nitrospira sp.]
MTIFRLWFLTALLGMASVAAAAESQQNERGKGLTVDDLVRGARSAGQNIEKEIPKIGPAVGKALKSSSANSSKKTQPQPQPSDKK